jgi:hypothetical protein
VSFFSGNASGLARAPTKEGEITQEKGELKSYLFFISFGPFSPSSLARFHRPGELEKYEIAPSKQAEVRQWNVFSHDSLKEY